MTRSTKRFIFQIIHFTPPYVSSVLALSFSEDSARMFETHVRVN